VAVQSFALLVHRCPILALSVPALLAACHEPLIARSAGGGRELIGAGPEAQQLGIVRYDLDAGASHWHLRLLGAQDEERGEVFLDIPTHAPLRARIRVADSVAELEFDRDHWRYAANGAEHARFVRTPNGPWTQVSWQPGAPGFATLVEVLADLALAGRNLVGPPGSTVYAHCGLACGRCASCEASERGCAQCWICFACVEDAR
jgi:hypothetical protein